MSFHSRAFSGFHLMPWLVTRSYQVLQTHKVSGKSVLIRHQRVWIAADYLYIILDFAKQSNIRCAFRRTNSVLFSWSSQGLVTVQKYMWNASKMFKGQGQRPSLRPGKTSETHQRICQALSHLTDISSRFKILKPLGQRQDDNQSCFNLFRKCRNQHVQTSQQKLSPKIECFACDIWNRTQVRFLSFPLDVCLTG